MLTYSLADSINLAKDPKSFPKDSKLGQYCTQNYTQKLYTKLYTKNGKYQKY